MKIEAGKFYRTRDGRRARVTEVCFSNGESYPILGFLGTVAAAWTDDGRFLNAVEDSPADLIAEWVDEPIRKTLAEMSQEVDDAWLDRWSTLTPYASLAAILDAALAQASEGKGKERHANGKPFLEQPIMEIGRMVGPGGHAYQIAKKAQEAVGMAARGEYAAAEAEMLGVIVYAAADVLLLREMAGDAE